MPNQPNGDIPVDPALVIEVLTEQVASLSRELASYKAAVRQLSAAQAPKEGSSK